MAGKGSVLQVMIDHPAQIEALDRMTKADRLEWSAFVKVDSGNQ
jgi:D-serine deaminase-like pyridoxal phosphate-dependent protein